MTNFLVWIGSPDEGKGAYNQVAGSDLQGNVVVVNVTNGQCLAMSANAASGKKLFIFDNSSCTDINPYFCETSLLYLFVTVCDSIVNVVIFFRINILAKGLRADLKQCCSCV